MIKIENLNGQEIFNQEFNQINQIIEIIKKYITYQNQKEIDNKEDNLDCQKIIDDKIKSLLPILPKINNRNKFMIYTYGKRNYNIDHIEPKILFNFDLSNYQSDIPQSFGSLKYYFGTDVKIQKMIVMSSMFEHTLRKILNDIELYRPDAIGIFCNHGKHRSVAMAEILKKYFYQNTKIRHLCIEAKKKN